jgi:LacI family transcriptional regulator
MTHYERQKRITLVDVATRVGVSYQTVSRVVNDHPNVSHETRQRVARAIKELDYRPNRAAQSLVTRRSYMLELITFGSEFYGPAHMIASVGQTARGLGYNLTVNHMDGSSPDDYRQALNSITDHLVDGIVMLAPTSATAVDALLTLCRGIPTVLVDSAPGAHSPSVIIDQRAGGRMIGQHLFALGHRAIAEITGPLNWYGAQARHDGVCEALEQVGLALVASREGDWSPDCGYTLTRALLADGVSFTALVTGNDHVALGAMRALREHGLRVPEDVSVVGFDNQPESAYYEPPLTTIHQDFAALGKQCIDYLVALIADPEMPVHQRVLYPHFVRRQSTDAPRR